jgi:predicted DNA-binding transcriptional regulator AlpA
MNCEGKARPAGRHLRTDEVAERLGIKVRTVQDWRCRTRTEGKLVGPPFITISERLVVYDEAEFLDWLEARRLISVSSRPRSPSPLPTSSRSTGCRAAFPSSDARQPGRVPELSSTPVHRCGAKDRGGR